jgi:hypothetical protein
MVGKELQRATEHHEIPIWLWHMWIPQLLTGLTRPEEPVVRPILREVGQVTPQALYYQLRGHLLNLREASARGTSEYKQNKAAAEANLAAARAAAGEAGDGGMCGALCWVWVVSSGCWRACQTWP